MTIDNKNSSDDLVTGVSIDPIVESKEAHSDETEKCPSRFSIIQSQLQKNIRRFKQPVPLFTILFVILSMLYAYLLILFGFRKLGMQVLVSQYVIQWIFIWQHIAIYILAGTFAVLQFVCSTQPVDKTTQQTTKFIIVFAFLCLAGSLLQALNMGFKHIRPEGQKATLEITDLSYVLFLSACISYGLTAGFLAIKYIKNKPRSVRGFLLIRDLAHKALLALLALTLGESIILYPIILFSFNTDLTNYFRYILMY
ncbi:hypothetical protein NEHOM01_2014 [Nematocida homosporus]|uniref:uncharacterized protein n=1 Tax=Nematocida homosporus TaxID=1912981 RepID=UPI0022211716|nr:uncharacterized protein NEHOM01_2014 [Nematocida homosporus]KAI5187216.1 hypothetical protein NEHOM01_2014 [Nematocida homosporus]